MLPDRWRKLRAQQKRQSLLVRWRLADVYRFRSKRPALQLKRPHQPPCRLRRVRRPNLIDPSRLRGLPHRFDRRLVRQADSGRVKAVLYYLRRAFRLFA